MTDWIVEGRVYQATPAIAAASVAVIGDSRVLFLEGEAWAFGPPVAGTIARRRDRRRRAARADAGTLVLVDTAQGSGVIRGP